MGVAWGVVWGVGESMKPTDRIESKSYCMWVWHGVWSGGVGESMS